MGSEERPSVLATALAHSAKRPTLSIMGRLDSARRPQPRTFCGSGRERVCPLSFGGRQPQLAAYLLQPVAGHGDHLQDAGIRLLRTIQLDPHLDAVALDQP